MRSKPKFRVGQTVGNTIGKWDVKIAAKSWNPNVGWQYMMKGGYWFSEDALTKHEVGSRKGDE